MNNHDERILRDRRSGGFSNMVFRFFVSNHRALGFLAGWSAYPIGYALLALLNR